MGRIGLGLGLGIRHGSPAGGRYSAGFVAASQTHLTCADQASVRMGVGSFTFAFWFYPDSAGQSCGLISKGGSGLFDYRIDTAVNDQIRLLIDAGNNLGGVDTAFNIAAWNFCVAWYDSAGQTSNIQVNGGAVSTVAAAGVNTNSACPFSLGLDRNNILYYGGRLDKVALWSGRALDAPTRAAVKNGTSGRNYSSLSAGELASLSFWFDFPEPSGSDRSSGTGSPTLTDVNGVLRLPGV